MSERRRYAGLPVLKDGFRPFFLGAGLWAVIAMILWLGVLLIGIPLPSAMDPLLWHQHEMLFGFVAAAITGFLLTAIPNWTQRLPVQGWRLASLAALWLAGRVIVALSALTGPAIAALIDIAFLVVLLASVLREISAGRNWRNLPIAAVISVLTAANILVHLEVMELLQTAALGMRLAIAMVLGLITLIGGRIIPSFTRNWLKRQNAVRLPSPFALPDRVAIGLVLLAGLAWTLVPDLAVTGVLLLLAGIANGGRLLRWCGTATLSEPLLWILHLGYAWLAVGLVLLGLSRIVTWLPQTAALHALTAGAMGTMIVAVMTRAIRGHTGHALTADRGTLAVYLLVTAAAGLRVLTPLVDDTQALVLAAGLCWIAGFALFLKLYAPMMLRGR